MNFFGHAAVASWRSSRPLFVLGAMLPDFASMIRARPPRAVDPAIAAGVALHHETDRVFHDTRVFRELTLQAHDELVWRGLARGPARAVAHVGTEILIDGVLAEDAIARRAYRAALTVARAVGRDQLEWLRDDASRTFGDLIAALAARGVSRRHRAPDVVARRVEVALAARPRLALAGGQRGAVAAWAAGAEPRVAASGPDLVRELRAGLVLESAPLR